MPLVPVIAVEWLTLFINAFAAEPQAVAGAEAVSADRLIQGEPSVAATVTDIDRAALATRLWSVFSGSNPTGRAQALSTLLSDVQLAPTIDSDGRLQWVTPLTHKTDLFAAACIACLTDRVCTVGWNRLGTCDGRDCADVYVYKAGRAPRRYCSKLCLNRAKVRAYRSRQGAERPPT